MSASTEKKNRQAAREAGTDKRTLAAAKEAKQKRNSKIKWTVGTIAVILVIALVIVLGATPILYTNTTAITVNGEKINPAEMNYYYSTQFYSLANQYGDYAPLMGLDVRGGTAGLAHQTCPMLPDGGTWKDYFLQAAQDEILQIRAIEKYASDNGIALTEEEIAQVDSSFEGMDQLAKVQGFGSVDKLFAANYGAGVDTEVVREANLKAALASKVIKQVSESFEYDDAQLEEYYKSLNGESDVYDYAYYYIPAGTVETVNADGETVNEPNDDTRAEALEKAEAIVASYKAAKGDDYLENFNAAVAENVEGSTGNHRTSPASGLGIYKEWLMGIHKVGDIGIVANADNNGQYVVMYLDRSDNHYPMAQVRHILVRAAADEEGNYTDEAKAEAKAKAEDILNEWQNGDKTEDSFAELANKYSEDPGSNTRGGLYDNVAKGQMVEEFDRFCFEGHKTGDTGIVYGESGGVPGYHVMYYVGEGELYSNYIAKNALLAQDMDKWMAQVSEGYEAVEGFGLRMVG